VRAEHERALNIPPGRHLDDLPTCDIPHKEVVRTESPDRHNLSILADSAAARAAILGLYLGRHLNVVCRCHIPQPRRPIVGEHQQPPSVAAETESEDSATCHVWRGELLTSLDVFDRDGAIR